MIRLIRMTWDVELQDLHLEGRFEEQRLVAGVGGYVGDTCLLWIDLIAMHWRQILAADLLDIGEVGATCKLLAR